jgi:acetylornithine/succinyldiaminopimelate/putrescine aminotransferase
MSFVDEVYRKFRPDILTGAHGLGGSGGGVGAVVRSAETCRRAVGVAVASRHDHS